MAGSGFPRFVAGLKDAIAPVFSKQVLSRIKAWIVFGIQIFLLILK